MTDQQAMAAVLAAVNAAVVPTAYEEDKVPSTWPSEFVVVNLTRTYGGVKRSDGTFAETGYRLQLDVTSHNSRLNVRKSLDDARAGLEFSRLSIDGRESTLIQFENATVATTKDGWHTARQFYTFVI